MLLAIVALAALCYANALHGDFVFDDGSLIVNNDVIKHPRNASAVFFSNLWGLIGQDTNYYRPLPLLLFMALHALFGKSPEAFHLVNIGLHAGTTALVFLTARTLLARSGARSAPASYAAFAAAALFAVHPVHTEAVAWISGVMDVACAFFSLLALYLYATRDDRAWSLLREALSLAALLLGLFSKEPAAVVPLVLVAHDLLFCRHRVSSLTRALRRWGPPFGVLIAYLVLRRMALGGLAPFASDEQGRSLQVILAVPRLFTLYLQKLAVPVALNAAHHFRPGVWTWPEVLLDGATLAVFVALAWAALRAGGTAAFGTLLCVLTLAPSLCVTALGQDLSGAFAERYLYFPSVGAALVVSAGLTRLESLGRRARWAAWAGLTVLVLVFGAMTLSRNIVWSNSVTLWSDCVRKSPDLPLARENLGLALVGTGHREEGTRELQVALRLDPRLAQSSLVSGVMAAKKGQMLQAVLSFQTALLYKPDFAEAHYNLAAAYEHMGWISAAIQEYRATLAQDTNHADANNNLGILLAQTNRLDEAIDHFNAAIRSRPGDPELHLNLARAYDAKGLAREGAEQRSLAAPAATGIAK